VYCGEGATVSAGDIYTPIGLIVTLSWFSGTFPVWPRAKEEGQTFAISFRTDFSSGSFLFLWHVVFFSLPSPLFFNHFSLFMY